MKERLTPGTSPSRTPRSARKPATEDEARRFTREREDLLTLLRERTLAMELMLEARDKRAETRKPRELALA